MTDTGLNDILLRHLDSGFPAGFAASVCSASATLAAVFGGTAVAAAVPGGPVAVRADTIFDVASLTKVVVTTPLVMLLQQGGDWDLDDPLSSHLPEASPSPVTLRHCLTHTSGLIWHRPFFDMYADPGAIRAAVTADLRTAEPGARIEYSDLNFMLLGWALEHRTGEPLELLARRRLFTPLAMHDSGFSPTADLRHRIAATEIDGDQRTRPGNVWGSVHDGNAFALGGVSGHAGLFSTVPDAVSYAQGLLDPDGSALPLTASTVSDMTAEQARDGSVVRALGWLLQPPDWGRWPPGTFWHTGFTGTSMLIAPAWDVAVVVFTNAVHPTRQLARFAKVRAALHADLAEHLATRVRA